VTITIQMLATIPAFHRLQPVTLEALQKYVCVLSYEAGETIYRQGDAPTGLYALQKGRVKLYRRSGEKTQIIAIVPAQECFGAESLPNETPSPCTAEALTPVTTIYISPEALRQLLLEHPDLLVTLLEIVSGRLRQLAILVHDLAFRDVGARLARVLLANAETDGEITSEGFRIRRNLTQQEIASLVGTAREVVYRTYKKFERQGVLRLTRTHIYILDPQKLAEIASQETR